MSFILPHKIKHENFSIKTANFLKTKKIRAFLVLRKNYITWIKL